MHSLQYLHNVNAAPMLTLSGTGSILLLLSSEMISIQTLSVPMFTVFSLILDFMTLFLDNFK